MAWVKRINREAVIEMYRAGCSTDEIAAAEKCGRATVCRIIAAYRRENDAGNGIEDGKHPIRREEVDNCRDNIREGQQVVLKIKEADNGFIKRESDEICTVEGKYRHLFLARDRRGKRRTATYIDMLLQDRAYGQRNMPQRGRRKRKPTGGMEGR